MIETTLCSPQPLLVEDYFQVCTGAYLVHSSAVAVKKSVLDATGGYLVGEPVGEDLEFYARLALKCPLAYQPMISAVYYCMIPNSALSVARWRCKRPPVVQTLDSYQDVPLSPAMRDSVRRYADWVLSGHVLAGLCWVRVQGDGIVRWPKGKQQDPRNGSDRPHRPFACTQPRRSASELPLVCGI